MNVLWTRFVVYLDELNDMYGPKHLEEYIQIKTIELFDCDSYRTRVYVHKMSYLLKRRQMFRFVPLRR